MILTDNIIYTFLAILLTTAFVTDIKFRRIPNWLTFPSMIIAVGCHSLLTGLDGFLFSIEGIGLGMAVFILFYIFGGMGAGDVKLMGAVGGFMGPKGVFAAFLFTAIIGGVYSVWTLIFYGHLRETIKRYGAILKTFILTKKLILIPSSMEVKKLRICYGVAIAVGTALSVFCKNLI